VEEEEEKGQKRVEGRVDMDALSDAPRIAFQPPEEADDAAERPFSVVVVQDPGLVTTSSTIALWQQQVGLIRLARGLIKEMGLLTEQPVTVLPSDR
jgi:hypothetical protein